MVGTVQLTGDRALLFPEGIALAWGVWALRRPDWCRLRLRLLVTPVLCAACGLAAEIVVAPRLLAELVALTAAIAIIAVTGAPVGPALAAAVLPAVAGVRSWTYLLAVFVTAAVVLGGVVARGRGSLARPQAGPPGRELSVRLALIWGITVAWLSVVAVFGLPLAAAAPPLLVSSFEWVVGAGPRTVGAGIRLALVLTLVWTAGAVAAWHAPSVGLAGLIALCAAAAVMAASGVTHPPVVAVSVVPLVLGPPGSWTDLLTGASSVAFAAAILYTSGSAALNVAVDRRFHLLRTPRGGTSQGATGLRHLITSRDTRSQP